MVAVIAIAPQRLVEVMGAYPVAFTAWLRISEVRRENLDIQQRRLPFKTFLNPSNEKLLCTSARLHHLTQSYSNTVQNTLANDCCSTHNG